MFCPIRSSSIQIHKATHSFVKAQKRNLILITSHRKIQTLGVKNTTPVIEMVISGTKDTTRQCQETGAKQTHEIRSPFTIITTKEPNVQFCAYESIFASIDKAVNEIEVFIVYPCNDLIVQLSQICETFPCCILRD